jgi:hypothetical protein
MGIHGGGQQVGPPPPGGGGGPTGGGGAAALDSREPRTKKVAANIIENVTRRFLIIVFKIFIQCKSTKLYIKKTTKAK